MIKVNIFVLLHLYIDTRDEGSHQNRNIFLLNVYLNMSCRVVVVQGKAKKYIYIIIFEESFHSSK